jgi:hypothetical protein
MTTRLILELLRIHLARHDIPCDIDALNSLLEVTDCRPALAVIGGGSVFPRLTAEGVEMVGEIVTFVDDLL